MTRHFRAKIAHVLIQLLQFFAGRSNKQDRTNTAATIYTVSMSQFGQLVVWSLLPVSLAFNYAGLSSSLVLKITAWTRQHELKHGASGYPARWISGVGEGWTRGSIVAGVEMEPSTDRYIDGQVGGSQWHRLTLMINLQRRKRAE